MPSMPAETKANFHSDSFDWLISPVHDDLGYQFKGGFCSVGYGFYAQHRMQHPSLSYGFYSRDGVVRLSPRYSKVEYFSEGLCAASLLRPKYESGYTSDSRGGFGYINYQGEYQIEPNFLGAGDFSDGVAVVSTFNETFVIDKQGERKFNLDHDNINWMFGNVEIAKMKDSRLRFFDSSSGGFGFLDANGNIVIPGIFDDVSDFSEGFALVCRGDKYAFIDVDGNKVGDYLFTEAHSFQDGLAQVKYELNGKEWSACLNSSGELLASVEGDSPYRFSDGLSGKVDEKSGLLGFVNSKLEYVIDPQYESSFSPLGTNANFSDGLAWINEPSGWSVIDKTGAKLLWEGINFFSANLFSEGVSVVQYDRGKYGAIGKL